MRLRAAYQTPAELIIAHDRDMAHGGLLVAGVDAGDALFQDVDLELEAGGRTLAIRAQVVQVIPGVGTAVTFTPSAVSGLAELVAAARALGPAPWPAATIAEAPEPPATRARRAAPSDPATAIASLRSAGLSEKIQAALHGSRDLRSAILRDPNPALWPYVLKNPNLQTDEVLAMARNTQLSPEIYKQIAERREWSSKPEIATAMVRNPKVPVPIALRLLDFVAPDEMRRLAKDTRTRTPIQQAARKRVITP